MSFSGPSLQGAAQEPRRRRPSRAVRSSSDSGGSRGHDTGHTGAEAPGPRGASLHGQMNSLSASPRENYSSRSPACSNHLTRLPGSFSGIFSEEVSGEKTPGSRERSPANIRNRRAAEEPDPASDSRPSGAGPRGLRAGGPALVALGAARQGRGHGAAAPTCTGAGTCGRSDVRLGIGPRGSFPRLPPPPAPHLRAVLQSLLDRQLVDPRHRGGGRATAGDAAAAHTSHANPPTAADPDPPSRSLRSRPSRATLARSLAVRREIPPLRNPCPASSRAYWLTATPVSRAGWPGGSFASEVGGERGPRRRRARPPRASTVALALGAASHHCASRRPEARVKTALGNLGRL